MFRTKFSTTVILSEQIYGFFYFFFPDTVLLTFNKKNLQIMSVFVVLVVIVESIMVLVYAETGVN